jgi:hypothetical protein
MTPGGGNPGENLCTRVLRLGRCGGVLCTSCGKEIPCAGGIRPLQRATAGCTFTLTKFAEHPSALLLGRRRRPRRCGPGYESMGRESPNPLVRDRAPRELRDPVTRISSQREVPKALALGSHPPTVFRVGGVNPRPSRSGLLERAREERSSHRVRRDERKAPRSLARISPFAGRGTEAPDPCAASVRVDAEREGSRSAGRGRSFSDEHSSPLRVT